MRVFEEIRTSGNLFKSNLKFSKVSTQIPGIACWSQNGTKWNDENNVLLEP